ncbi:disintegrin and metalloproteinase domain-containing protein 21-like [Microcebus murinus]|uniref:disintegrin and metalloproteinase domain-containing protein 21-like n=1 Tax=Microcebus murinus TaxID=30608 RepID=UPI003F6B94EC
MHPPELGREAGRGPGALRVSLVLLGLWALLASVQGSQGRPSWRYVSSEVVIPRKETHRGKGFQVPGWLSYSLRFGGRRHVIHLRPKKLLQPRHLLVMTQDDQGALQMDYPYIPTDCHYLGYLEEIPLSMVTVDTCYGGLDGVMKLDDLAYEIKPLKDSRSFEHVVSEIVADHNATGPMYKLGLKEDVDTLFSEVNPSEAPRNSAWGYAAHVSRVRSQVQFSLSMYRVFGNITKCTDWIVSMSSLVDTFLHSIDSGFLLHLITIYSQRDPAAMNDFRVPGSEMHNYYVTEFYRKLTLVGSVLLIKEGPTDSEWEPMTYTLCNENNLLYTGYLDRHYFLIAVIVAHKIMRSYGFYYDSPGCGCLRRTFCVMQRHPGLTDSFSNCSYVHFQHIAVSGIGRCVFYPHAESLNRSVAEVRCGNSIVEETEECDCGSLKQCYTSQCCQMNCRLTSRSTCHVGECCTNCSYSAPGTLCRPILNICDLPEYCTGGAASCPTNTYMQDGTPCTEEGYCYQGNCTDRSVHCKEIFGIGAVDGPEPCYGINIGNIRFGHCSRIYHELGFTACAAQDKMCGRLQCTNVTHLPRLQEHVSFHQSVISGFQCFGLDSHRGTKTTDAGHVKTGSICSPGKFCNNSVCNGTVTDLHYDCAPQKCNRRGVCNNRRNCHCHVGWDPPQCQKRGFGGSVDSGRPPGKMRAIQQSEVSLVYLRLAFGRLYILIAVLLFGVATGARTVTTTKVEEKTITA